MIACHYWPRLIKKYETCDENDKLRPEKNKYSSQVCSNIKMSQNLSVSDSSNNAVCNSKRGFQVTYQTLTIPAVAAQSRRPPASYLPQPYCPLFYSPVQPVLQHQYQRYFSHYPLQYFTREERARYSTDWPESMQFESQSQLTSQTQAQFPPPHLRPRQDHPRESPTTGANPRLKKPT